MHEEGENLVSSRFHRADLGRLGGTNRNVNQSTKTGMNSSHDLQIPTKTGWYFSSSSQFCGANWVEKLDLLQHCLHFGGLRTRPLHSILMMLLHWAFLKTTERGMRGGGQL